jgi:hypothetical protein
LVGFPTSEISGVQVLPFVAVVVPVEAIPTVGYSGIGVVVVGIVVVGIVIVVIDITIFGVVVVGIVVIVFVFFGFALVVAVVSEKPESGRSGLPAIMSPKEEIEATGSCGRKLELSVLGGN